MSWKPEVEELGRREAMARELGGPEKVARQHAAGRLLDAVPRDRRKVYKPRPIIESVVDVNTVP